MKEHINKVLDGSKDLTTRLYTSYRNKLRVGDTAYIYTGIRTPNAKKWGEAEITDRLMWNQADLNKDFFDTFPKKDINHKTFYQREGLDSWDDLMEFFSQDRYKDQYLITYEFKLVPTLDEFL